MIESDSEEAVANLDLRRTRRRNTASSPVADRLPPHAHEMEQCLLGCQLLSPNECIPQLLEKTEKPEIYYDLRHQTVQSAITEMFKNRTPIDLISVQQALKEKQLLEQVGGIAYLCQLQDAVPSTADISYYLSIVLEKHVLRSLIQTCAAVVGRVFDYEGEVDDLLDEVERDIFKIAESRTTSPVKPMAALVDSSLKTLEDYFGRDGKIMGISTGYPDLDRMTDGMKPNELIILAARPSMGKTSLAMNIVEHVILVEKLPVAVFSLEMSAEALNLRSMCSLARVSLRSVRDGFMNEADFPKLAGAAGKLRNARLYIDDSAGLSILQLRSKARRMHQQHGIKLIVVDYLQLLCSNTKRARDNRQQEVSEISLGLKNLAKELKLPMIALCQLNRDIERRKGGRPKLSDLRESGSIEQDADVIGFLYRPAVSDDDDEIDEADGLAVNLYLCKQRNNPTGEVNLTFLKNYTRFESAAKVSDEDVPEQNSRKV